MQTTAASAGVILLLKKIKLTIYENMVNKFPFKDFNQR